MTTKSAHRDVALWQYERPSRGYFGFHLRARTEGARLRLRDRLAAMMPRTPHLFRLGGTIADTQPWTRTMFGDLLMTVGGPPADGAAGLSIGIASDQHEILIGLLGSVAPHGEASVIVETAAGAAPLWVWWDP